MHTENEPNLQVLARRHPPQVIQPTTCPPAHLLQDDTVPPLPEPNEQMAVLPRVIRTLVQRRRTVKDLLKSERDPVRPTTP